MVEQIRDAIRQSEMTVVELAKKADVSHPQLYRFLTEERTLTLPAAARVCEVLGLRLVGPEAQPDKPAPRSRKKA
jgi:DNA-binding phage protein